MFDRSLKNLSDDSLFTTLILDDEYCPMNFDHLEVLMEDVKMSWNSDDKNSRNIKGRTLEHIAVYLLSCVEPFEVTHDVDTPMNQLDCFIRIRAFKGNSPFLLSLGHYFLGECKNEDETVGITHVQKVGTILDLHDMKLAVIFSRKTLAGAGKYESAQAFVISQMHSFGRRILNLTYADLKIMCDTKTNFLTLLERKYTELTLTKLRPNTLVTELAKLRDLYKDGTLSEEQFEDAKKAVILEYTPTQQ